MKLNVLLFLLSLLGFGIAGSAGTIEISGPVYGQNCLQYSFQIRKGVGETISSVNWSFGDGQTTTINPYDIVSHGYAASGTYTVTAVVTSTSGTYTLSTTLNATGNNNANGAGFTVSGTFPAFSFTYTGVSFYASQFTHGYSIDFGDGTPPQTGNELVANIVFSTHTYAHPGNYTVTLMHTFDIHPVGHCEWMTQMTVSVPEEPCCTNFAPEPGEKYWLNAWVQETVPAPVMSYSDKVYIELEFVTSGGVNQYLRLDPSGDIIEGWQRIAEPFTIPSGTITLNINMINENVSSPAYFDDIRVHPFNSSMKSYVYDPETLWLKAELDDNNYATFYEYDKEGQLVRTKKETERGVMTIQESRSSNTKKD